MKHYLHLRWKGIRVEIFFELRKDLRRGQNSDESRALKDPRLGWDASRLEVTSINHKKIWTPDISYWNSVSEDSGLDLLSCVRPWTWGFPRIGPLHNSSGYSQYTA